MAERKRVIGIAVATALGVGTFAAIRYSKQFEQSAETMRGQITGLVADHINYSELAKNPLVLASFRQQIPGEWRVSSVIADILCDPATKEWFEISALTQSLIGTGKSFYHQVKPADTGNLAGLYIYRETTENPTNPPKFFRDIVQMGRVTNWLVGENHLPMAMRDRILQG